VSELKKRVGVALWGIPLLIFLVYMGGYFFLILLLIINGMALWEFYTMFHNREIYPLRIIGVSLATVFLLTVFFFPAYSFDYIVFIILFILISHISHQQGLASKNTAFTLLGFFYITLFLSLLLQLVQHFPVWNIAGAANTGHAAGRYVMALLGSIWICDTAAYTAGRKLGKHKLAPTVSPNKTVEGALFGFLFAIISFYAFGKLFLPQMSWGDALVSGVLVGVFGQIGDLVESRFKRDAGVKDTSTLLPGHGGILDRFDSLIFVSPFLWAFFYLRSTGVFS